MTDNQVLIEQYNGDTVIVLAIVICAISMIVMIPSIIRSLKECQSTRADIKELVDSNVMLPHPAFSTLEEELNEFEAWGGSACPNAIARDNAIRAYLKR